MIQYAVAISLIVLSLVSVIRAGAVYSAMTNECHRVLRERHAEVISWSWTIEVAALTSATAGVGLLAQWHLVVVFLGAVALVVQLVLHAATPTSGGKDSK